MVANKVTKTNRFQKRTAAKTAVVKNGEKQKEENKDKDHGEGSTTQETYVWVTDVYNITYYMFCFHSCHCNSSLYSMF